MIIRDPPDHYYIMNIRETLEGLLYAHNDTVIPSEGIVELLETITRDYVKEITQVISDVARVKGELDDECILFSLRLDRKKSHVIKNRIEEYRIIENASILSEQSFRPKKRTKDGSHRKD